MLQGPQKGLSTTSLTVLQETAELRLPLEIPDLVEVVDAAYGSLTACRPPEVFLELRAQLTTATPWAPMVRL